MAVIGVTDNKTGFTAVKTYCGEHGDPIKMKKELQAFYDRLFGKNAYTFFVYFGFFYPYTVRIVHPDMNIHTCRGRDDD